MEKVSRQSLHMPRVQAHSGPQKVYTEETGQETALLTSAAAPRQNHAQRGGLRPVFPGRTTIHEEDERWSVEDIMKNAHIMAKVLVGLAEIKK